MAVTGNLIDEYKNLISGTFLTEEDFGSSHYALQYSSSGIGGSSSNPVEFTSGSMLLRIHGLTFSSADSSITIYVNHSGTMSYMRFTLGLAYSSYSSSLLVTAGYDVIYCNGYFESGVSSISIVPRILARSYSLTGTLATISSSYYSTSAVAYIFLFQD